MALHLSDKWVWDFWFAQDGPDTHLFYLQADRALKDERLRHWNVSVGHAVSQDLRRWEVLPDALRPSAGQPDAFDSYTTWTGSIIRHESRWYMFYTGGRRSENGLVQRIGLATSDDLLRWHKYPANPVITADPRWYELLDLSVWHDQAWRDPCVFRHPETGQFHAFITARAKSGPPDARGVIGHAVSSDLLHWEVQPPVTEPGEFGHMEVPQWVAINGRYYLLFCVPGEHASQARRARLGDQPTTGTHYLAADSPLGPYHYLTDTFLAGDRAGSLYSGKLVQDGAGRWMFMAFRNFNDEGAFIGDITDPMPLRVEPDGRLMIG